MRSGSGTRTTLLGALWVLALAGGILAHRAGLLPSWVYAGRFRDEVKRRTGVDLADRSAPAPVLEVRRVRGSGGRYPTLVVDVRNATDSALRHVDMWATFHLATEPAGRTPVARVADRTHVLPAGATRTVTLRAEHPQGLGVATRGPLLTADLYWTFHDVAPHRRGRLEPRMAMIPVQ